MKVEKATFICELKNVNLPLEIENKKRGVEFNLLLRKDQKEYAQKICEKCCSGICSYLIIKNEKWDGHLKKNGNTIIFQREDENGFVIGRENLLNKGIRIRYL
jgi:hypothetical protein